MNEIWLSVMKEAMKEKHITTKQLAKQLEITEKEMRQLLNGDHRISFKQLSLLVEILQINVDEVMGEQINTNPIQLLQTETEIKINQIARSIPKKNRPYFLRSIEYLAVLFEEDDTEEADTKKSDPIS